MPPAAKKARQAKQQWASGSKHFESGMIEDLLELPVDPTFIPDISENDQNEDVNDWAFSLLDRPAEITEISDDSEPDEDMVEVHCGKRKHHEEDFERLDYAEACAARAAQTAKEFWADIMKPVCLLYPK
jgi:hypothetical protein